MKYTILSLFVFTFLFAYEDEYKNDFILKYSKPTNKDRQLEQEEAVYSTNNPTAAVIVTTIEVLGMKAKEKNKNLPIDFKYLDEFENSLKEK